MKKKILWIFLSFLLVASLVLASCVKEEEAVEEEEEEEEEEVVEEEEEEEEVVVPVVGEPQYGGTLTVRRELMWDGIRADTFGIGTSNCLHGAILDHLFVVDFEKYGPRGTGENPCNELGFELNYDEEYWTGLVERWEVTADRLVLHLRPGVYWAAYGKEHIMEPRELTAADVAFSLTRWLNFPDNAYATVAGGGHMESIYAEDKYTVVVKSSRFEATWVRFVAGWGLAIAAPEVVEAGIDDWNNLIGTGPFMFKEYVEGSYMSYDRNPNFWGTATINGKVYDDIPFIDELVYPIIVDESTRVAALRTGKYDIYHGMPMKYEDTLAQTSPELLKWRSIYPEAMWLALRCDIEPFDNKAVRRAMMIALDIPAIAEAVFIKGEPYCLESPANPIYTPLEELPAESRELFDYDPDKAEQILADEGITERLKVRAITAGDILHIDTLALVKSYWEVIGVDLEILVYEPVTATSMIRGREGYEVEVLTWTPHVSPWQLVHRSISKFIPPGGFYNQANYLNADIDRLCSAAELAVDIDERSAILKEAHQIIISDVPYIGIGAPYVAAYWWPWVKNYYGETCIGSNTTSHLEAATWIDQDVKAEMGYK